MTVVTTAREEPTRVATSAPPLIELQELVVDYLMPSGRVRAVDNVSLNVHAGEMVGLAGESGCGKTTIAQAIVRILRPPGEITGGRIVYKGKDIAAMRASQLREFRWRDISLVFQGAMNVLNPVMRVGDQFVDRMQAHRRVRRSVALGRAGELLEMVGIERSRLRSYPHELSNPRLQTKTRRRRRRRSVLGGILWPRSVGA